MKIKLHTPKILKTLFLSARCFTLYIALFCTALSSAQTNLGEVFCLDCDYDFSAEAEGDVPLNVTPNNGASFQVTDIAGYRAMELVSLGSPDDAAAVADMDLFPSDRDQQLTWQESYTNGNNANYAFTLRANGQSDRMVGLKLGYMFQVRNKEGRLDVIRADVSRFKVLAKATLPAQGPGNVRHYMATIQGDELRFGYSDDNGATVTTLVEVTDTTYAEGSVQYSGGWGGAIGGSYLGNIDMSSITIEGGPNGPTNPESCENCDYDFSVEAEGDAPLNVTPINGADFQVTGIAGYSAMELVSLGAPNDAAAVAEMDLFLTATDQQLTWQESYTNGKEANYAFTLRANGQNERLEGLKQGYMFQVRNKEGRLDVIRADVSRFKVLARAALPAQGPGNVRQYTATVEGGELRFGYSDDNGVTVTTLVEVTDATYSEGTVQYSGGWGGAIGGSYLGSISMSSTIVDGGVENPPVPPTGNGDVFTVENIHAYQVIQQDNGFASINISGFYPTNDSPAGIEARWNGNRRWTSLTVGRGGYAGVLENQPVGQGTLEVRYTDNTRMTTTVDYVGVGDIFVIAGQSNAAGYGRSLNEYSHPSIKAGMFGNDDVWKELEDSTDDNTNQVDAVSSERRSNGSNWPISATYVLASQGIPIAFVPCAKGSSSILEWQPNYSSSTLYGSMFRRINAVGGKVKGVVWFQGENESSNRRTQPGYYEESLNNIVNSVARDFPGTKVMVGQLGPSRTELLDLIRGEQFSVATTNVNALLGPAPYDINLEDGNGDNTHFVDDEDQQEFGRRWGLAMLRGFYGVSYGYGPFVDERNSVYDKDSNTIYMTFISETAPMLNPSSSTADASVFQLFNGGNQVEVANVIVGENNVRIIPSRTLNTSQSINLTYGSSLSGVEHAVYDMNDLPARTFYDVEIGEGAPPSTALAGLIEAENSFEVFPNPISDILNITGIDESTVVKIYTIQGVQILETSKKAIDISHLPKGIYLVTASGNTQTLKVMKQ